MEYAQDHDDTWDEPDSIMSISKIIEPSLDSRLKRLDEQVSYLNKSQPTKRLSNPYLICDQCGGPHEVEECNENATTEQACLSSHDILDDPSLLPFYQNNDFAPWGNLVKSDEEGEHPGYKIRSTFEDDLGYFVLEKDLQLKGLDNLFTSLEDSTRALFSKLEALLDCLGNPQTEQNDPLLAITTRAGTTTKDPPYPTQPSNIIEPDIPHEEEGNMNSEIPEPPPPITPSPPTPTKHTIKVPYPSRLKNQKTENDEKRFLSYLKDAVVTIPLLDACYHMPKYST